MTGKKLYEMTRAEQRKFLIPRLIGISVSSGLIGVFLGILFSMFFGVPRW